MDVSAAVDGWVTNALGELDTEGLAQIDLDDLLEDEPTAAAMVGIECLERVMAVCCPKAPTSTPF